MGATDALLTGSVFVLPPVFKASRPLMQLKQKKKKSIF